MWCLNSPYSIFQLPFVIPTYLHFTNWNHRAVFTRQSASVKLCMCPYVTHERNSWISFLRWRHCMRRCQVIVVSFSTVLGKILSYFLQGYEILGRPQTLEQLTTPPETRECLMHSGNARCKCMRPPPLLPPFPFPFSRRAVGGLCTRLRWGTHSLFLPPPVGWRVRARTRTRPHAEAEEVKKPGDNN